MPVFQTYDATVNLKLSNNNQVRKSKLSAPEVMMLRAIHGGEDAVHNLRHTGAVEISNADMRGQLDGRYGKARSALNKDSTRISLAEIGFPAGVPLPTMLEGVEHDKKLKPAKPRIPLHKLAKDKKDAARAEMRAKLEAEAEARAEAEAPANDPSILG